MEVERSICTRRNEERGVGRQVFIGFINKVNEVQSRTISHGLVICLFPRTIAENSSILVAVQCKVHIGWKVMVLTKALRI